MKRILLILLLTSIVPYLIQAQPSASGLKLIYNADNSLSPPYIIPYATAESRVMELPDTTVQLFHININYWGDFSYPLPMHLTKFRFEGTSDIGIDSGLVINTGRIRTDSISFGDFHMGIAWPAVYHSTGYNLGTNYLTIHDPSRYTQYPELVALNDGDSIIDAVVVEFDLVAQGNTLLLDYVFASEEYPENLLKSPNDQVGIFLSRPGVPGYQNIARVPAAPICLWALVPLTPR